MKKDYRSEPFEGMVTLSDSISKGAMVSKSEYTWGKRTG